MRCISQSRLTLVILLAWRPRCMSTANGFGYDARMGEPTSSVGAGGKTPLAALLWMTFLCSLSTSVFWGGVYFIAEHDYGFSSRRNLVMGAAMGLVYATGAILAGRITGWMRRWMSTRRVLALIVITQALLCMLPVLWRAEWSLWVAAMVVNLLAALLWPVVESYLTAGRHGRDMRAAIGWFNVTWTFATALMLVIMAPLMREYAIWSIGLMVIVNFKAAIGTIFLPRDPASHDEDAAGASVTSEYPYLLQASRALLPLGYILVSAMMPILPHKLAAMGVDVQWKTAVTSVWMFARVAAIALMWRLPFWHGRWGTLLLGGGCMVGGVGAVLLSATLPVLLAGLIALGVGMAVVYYATLYYSMSVGRAAVDAGGKFEAIIGMGYLIGPIAGLTGARLSGDRMDDERGVVVVLTVIAAVAALAALKPFLTTLKRRRGA